MTKKSDKYIPVAAIVLLHMLLYSALASFTLRQNQVQRLGNTLLPFLISIAIAAWLWPKAARWFGEAWTGKPSRAGRWRLAPALTALAAFLAFTALPGYREWVASIPLRHAANFFLAVQIPAAYHVFYNLIPPRRRGVWYGTGLATGFLFWRVLMVMAARMGGSAADGTVHPGLHAVWLVHIVVAAALLVVVTYGMTRIPVQPVAEKVFPAVDAEGLSACRRTIGLLFAASGLVYVMNAFLDIRMFPVLLDRTTSPFEPLQLTAALSCPLIGWLLDRGQVRGYRIIAAGCAYVFILAPSLAALGDSPALYRVVHALAAAGQFAVLVVFTTILAGLSGTGDTVSRLPTLLYAWRSISVIGFLLVRVTLQLPTGAAVLMATVMAAGYFLLARRVELSDKSTSTPEMPDKASQTMEQTEQAVQAEQAEQVKQKPRARRRSDKGGKRVFDLEQAFTDCHLSPREREVASLWVKGVASRDMAVRLGITESTVKTHVKNIRGKFGVSNRTTFLLRMMGKKEEGKNK